MQYQNKLSFQVSGRRALFSDPLTRMGGEKMTYSLPTYQALKGVMESAYWKPSLFYVVDRVRIVNPIRTESQNVRPLNMSGGNTLSIYTYLTNVVYQVEVHFEWNLNRPELACDRNEDKHFQIAKRAIAHGGRRDIFLGTRECQAYIEPCRFGEGAGAYDGVDMDFSLMVHGIDYPDESGKNELAVRLWTPRMRSGIVEFLRPEDCTLRRPLRVQEPKSFIPGKNFSLCEQEVICP